MLTTEDKGDYFLKPYLRAKNILWESVDISSINEMWFSKNELEKYRVRGHDLLVSEGGEVGRTCIWKKELKECYIQNSVHKVTVKEDFSPLYFLYQFYMFGYQGHFDAIVDRISIAHLTREKLKEVSFLVPSKTEQKVIASYLDKETAKIDDLIKKVEEAILKLKEYRSALITDAVTGKIDVREK
jgi:type I restriction enzyme S subunit